MHARNNRIARYDTAGGSGIRQPSTSQTTENRTREDDYMEMSSGTSNNPDESIQMVSERAVVLVTCKISGH